MSRYLSVADLIRINERMVSKWGGVAGIRDAALCESLLQNHPFLDGNKRAAVVATAVFLRWNGFRLEFVDHEMYEWLMSLYETGRVTKRSLDAWIRAHAVEGR